MKNGCNYLLMFLLVIFLIVVSEIESLLSPLLGILTYGIWLLILVNILRLRELSIDERNLFTALTVIPAVRLAVLLIPVTDYSLKIVIVYYLLLMAALYYIFTLSIKRPALPERARYYPFIIPLFLIPAVQWLLIRPLGLHSIVPIQIAIVGFASFVQVLYFQGVIQFLAEKCFGVSGIVLTGVLVTATQAGIVVTAGWMGVIFLGLLLYTNIAISALYYETRSLPLTAFILFCLHAFALFCCLWL